MKKAIVISTLMLLMHGSLQAASITYEKVNACLSKKDNKCLIEVSRYDSRLQESIGSSTFDGSTEFSALAKYYDLARKNQAADIVNLYSKNDGSYELKKAEIQKDPLLYAQMYQLGRVDVNRAVAFGSYRMLGVSWYDANGKKMANWTELLHCENSCQLSQLLMMSNATIDFMTIIASGSEYHGAAIDGAKIEQESSSQYPAAITFTVVQDDATRLQQASKSLVALYGSSKENIAVAQAVSEQLVDNVLSVFGGIWANPQQNVYTLIPSKNLEGRVFSAANLLVLSNFFASLESIAALAVLPSASVDYVIYQGKKEDANFYGFFPIGHDGKIVSLVDLTRHESIVAQALQNPIIFRGLISRLKQEAVDITPQKTEQFKVKKLHQEEPQKIINTDAEISYWYWVLAFFGLILVVYVLVRRIKK